MLKTRSTRLQTLLWLLLVAAVAALVLQNRDPVQTRFLLITVEMPQILLLALTTGAGFALGVMAPALWRPGRVWPRPAAARGFSDDMPPPRNEATG